MRTRRFPPTAPTLSKDTSELIGDLADQAGVVAALLQREGFPDEARTVRGMADECAAMRARLERLAGTDADPLGRPVGT